MYALWFYVLTFTGAFGFMDLGFGVAVGRYVGVALGRNDFKAVREYWGTGNAIAIPLLAAMGFVFAVVGVMFGPRWFNVDPTLTKLLRWSFVAGGVGLFLSYYAQFWFILSQAHLDFKFLGVVRIVINLLQILPSIFLAALTGNPLILIVWGTIVGALQLAIYIWHARKNYRLSFDFAHAAWHRAREMAAFTAKIFASLIVASFTSTADRLLLGKLAPALDFTNYSISSNAGQRVVGLSVSVMGPVFHNTSRAVGRGSGESVAAVYDEIFNFTFPWYALISIWAWLWHPVLLRLWLGQHIGASISPIFVPIIVGCCFNAISNISGAQLGPLNRVGAGLVFSIMTGALLITGVFAGWHWNGIVGVAWGFLFSRIIGVIQDFYVIRLVNAGGWLAASTWRQLGLQLGIGLLFSVFIFIWPRESLWQLIPATLHGGGVTVFLLHQPIRNLFFRSNATAATGLP
jgi:O-antigen/teichoic acid export membrane protein